VALAARLLHGLRIPRVTGVSLFLDLVAEAARRGWRRVCAGGD